MVKYVFEVEKEIVFCNDCPIMNSDCDYGWSCNLGVEIDNWTLDVPRPESCPLVRIYDEEGN
jgi:hypothetical protein